jgi:hypothetical protein
MIVEWPKLLLECLALDPGLKSSLGIRRAVQVKLSMNEDGQRQWTVSERAI